ITIRSFIKHQRSIRLPYEAIRNRSPMMCAEVCLQ
uniref:Uncharacterized protein n=1 Tax=Parascaris univalens TaxID=6257 RepID=A0A915AZ02_PARUN